MDKAVSLISCTPLRLQTAEQTLPSPSERVTRVVPCRATLRATLLSLPGHSLTDLFHSNYSINGSSATDSRKALSRVQLYWLPACVLGEVAEYEC